MPDDRLFHRRAGHSERVNLLNDLEFRVWWQFVMSADDFGVMRFSAVTLQADNDHLSNRPAATVMRCFKAVKDRGLIRTFVHQNREYAYQHDWQYWQKINYPRSTNHPAPPPEALAECCPDTRELFTIHPGGAGRKRKERSENVPETVPETFSEGSSLMRAGPPAKRLTANGYGLTANGSDADKAIARARAAMAEPVPVVDGEWHVFRDAYPAKGRVTGRVGEDAFFDARRGGATLAEMLEALENQKAGDQWAQGRIPNMLKWLGEGRWVQRHEPAKPSVAGDVFDDFAGGRS